MPLLNLFMWLQTTQPTSGGAVTVDSSCCANCVKPPRPQHWGPDLPFFGHAGHADPAQHIEITHPNNVNLKLAFHKVASFHPHYSTFTPQTYHHPVHRFRSWPMQMTSQSHPHTQVRVQPRNTYNHTYTKFLPGQNKTTSY